jgi:hypothetical protein
MSTTTETLPGTCAPHGEVRAERHLPKVSFPSYAGAPALDG